jgi:hypothetical protein
MLRNRKLGGWVCGILLAAFTLLNSFACVLYCQFSQGMISQERHSCCGQKSNPGGAGTMIRGKGSLPCPAEMALLPDIPLILQDNSQANQKNRDEVPVAQVPLATSPGMVVPHPFASSLRFIPFPILHASSLILFESTLRI